MLDPTMGNGIRKQWVHALCLTTMFGYDVPEKLLARGKVLSTSLQHARCIGRSGFDRVTFVCVLTAS
ncbi:MAG TPA: hypothetical protein DEF45_25790 [Rhodopirellula sp.]|nr:hypothetical protein [Rhodopirellula sp.]